MFNIITHSGSPNGNCDEVYYTPMRVVKIKSSDTATCRQGYRAPDTHMLMVVTENGAATRDHLTVSYKVKHTRASLLCVCPREMRTYTHTKIYA